MKTHYTLEGTPNSPVIVFSNSLGSDLRMWDELVPSLLPYFRVLRYDTRGHGQSAVTPGEYTISMLAKDLIDLVDDLGIAKFAFCGLSMGGLIGQYLGIHYGDRLTHLILSNTGAKIGDEARWTERIQRITHEGTQGMAVETMERWFSDEFYSANPAKIQTLTQMFAASPDVGYIACCAAIRDADFRKQLTSIQTPTLVVTGEIDPVTNVEQAEYLVSQIPDAQLCVIPGTKHLCATENPALYVEKLLDFMIGSGKRARGMHVRRTVLGSEHVDRSLASKNEFNADFQEFITEYAWGEIWARPGISKSQKSYVTLAVLIALNRKDEFKMHVRAAFNNGLTQMEIKEIIMHCSLYCGLPAANEAIHISEEVFKHMQHD